MGVHGGQGGHVHGENLRVAGPVQPGRGCQLISARYVEPVGKPLPGGGEQDGPVDLVTQWRQRLSGGTDAELAVQPIGDGRPPEPGRAGQQQRPHHDAGPSG
jgi:hypothetical protein